MSHADTNLKSATEWLRTRDFDKYEIASPDGWTDKGFDLSEKISKKVFLERVMNSKFVVK